MIKNLKKMIIFCLLAIHPVIEAAPLIDHVLEENSIRELISICKTPQEGSLLETTQKYWLRNPNQERWEMTEINPEQRSLVIDWAQRNGFFFEWTPSQSQYDKALVLGSTTYNMQERFDYLKKLWLRGIRFQEIVWLTGERPLMPSSETLPPGCLTESDAARYIHEHTDLPPEMRALPVRFVAVPMKGSARPNTKDTIIAWGETHPPACLALFISSQPFCGYQFAVIKGSVPSEVMFDVAGQGVANPSHPAGAAIVLDTVTRWLYQDNLNAKAS